MILQEKADSVIPLSIYFHIPFCASICDFCSFYQKVPRRDEVVRYLEGMEAELKLITLDRDVDTIFWGGGTPGLLPAKDLYNLGRAMLDKLSKPPREWTVELSPSTVKKDKLEVLWELGVTRVSMGVQSFNDRLLEKLGRQHSRQQINKAIETINQSKVEVLNLDLIFSIPGQTLDEWLMDIKYAISCAPHHLSTYCLTFEEDTALYFRLRRGEINQNTQGDDSDFYVATWEALEDADYRQYEISNYARKGFECLHNKNTWRLFEWIGFGPSAASQFRGRRYRNVPSLDEWLKGLEDNQLKYIDEVELTTEMLAVDSIIFGLRMNEGINLQLLKKRFPTINFNELNLLWNKLKGEGLIEKGDEKIIRMTPRGRLLADSIAVEILSHYDPGHLESPVIV